MRNGTGSFPKGHSDLITVTLFDDKSDLLMKMVGCETDRFGSGWQPRNFLLFELLEEKSLLLLFLFFAAAVFVFVFHVR